MVERRVLLWPHIGLELTLFICVILSPDNIKHAIGRAVEVLGSADVLC